MQSKLRIEKPPLLDNKEYKTKAKKIKETGPDRTLHQSPTNMLLQKPYSLVKMNTPCDLTKMWKGTKNKPVSLSEKQSGMQTHLLRWRRVEEHFYGKLGDIPNLRYLSVCLLVR